MDIVKLREYETLSPFEIKDFLAKAASKTASASDVAYLNAGRGNPNWIATEPREAFFLLGQFAITESKRVLRPAAGRRRHAAGPAASPTGWRSWLDEARRHARRRVPRRARALGRQEVRLRRRTSSCTNWSTRSSATTIRCPTACSCTTSRSSTSTCSGRCAASRGPKGTFKLYAVEGGTAAMCYIFKSMKTNRLLNAGDTIALGTPIFTPYLEMPHLEDYDLNIVNVQAQAGEPLPVRRRGAEEAARSEGQGVLRRQPGQPERRRAERARRSRRSAPSSRSAPT